MSVMFHELYQNKCDHLDNKFCLSSQASRKRRRAGFLGMLPKVDPLEHESHSLLTRISEHRAVKMRDERTL